MHIYVDADACPVKAIILKHAKRLNIPVTMITDTSHELHDGYSSVITVDTAKDSADIRLANLVKNGDIVVTQDYGLAALSMAKGGRAINQNGLVFTPDNIDRLLYERHVHQKIRSAGGRTYIKKRTQADNTAFEREFSALISQTT